MGKRPRLPRITAEQFRDARVFAGLSREAAAELLGVSLRTVGHWETGKARPAFAAFKLLRVYRHGDLVDPRWSGYRIVRGKLVTPENHELSPSDMAWITLLVRRASAFTDLLKWRDSLGGGEARASASAPTGLPAYCALGAAVPASGQGRVQHPAGVVGILGTTTETPPTPEGGYQLHPPQNVRTETPPSTVGGYRRGRQSPCSNTGRILVSDSQPRARGAL